MLLNRAAYVLAVCLLCPSAVLAGRPLVTDDAALTQAGSCQSENWVQHAHGLTEWYVLPACNPGGNFEVTGGLIRFRIDDTEWTNRFLAQGKTLFALPGLSETGIASGLAVGGWIADGEEAGIRGFTNLFAYLPFTIQLIDERLSLHANLGWTRDRLLDRDRASWGLGAQFALDDRWSIFGETYGDDVDDPFAQTGLSVQLLSGVLQLDLTAGRQLGSARETEFVSIGLNVYLPAVD